MTLPKMTLFTSSGATPPAARAALAACSAKSVALWSFRTPPYAPNGVRLPATINTPGETQQYQLEIQGTYRGAKVEHEDYINGYNIYNYYLKKLIGASNLISN